MKLVFSTDIKKEKWDLVLKSLDHPAFFQSWEWGDVEIGQKRNVTRYILSHGQKDIGVMQIIDINARRGHFLHVRHGPILQKWDTKTFREISQFLKQLAKKKNASFIRISPLVLESDNKDTIFLANNFRYSPVYNLDAENRWVLNLASEESELLLQMRKTTRYMIKKGEKEGIRIISTQDVKDFKKFEKIYNETAQAKGFIPHKLVQEEFELFGKKGMARLYLAYLGKKLLAGAVVVYCGNSAIYRHGATSMEGRKTSASYLLQWYAICDAKKKGFTFYDFWGVAKDENKDNPWFGLSQFKKGFGGEQIDYVHSMDLPVSWKYWVTYGIDFATKIKKGHFLR